MESFNMKVGLVGFGMAAERFHAPLIAAQPGLRLSHVVERRRRRAEQLYPNIVTLTDPGQMWESEVDVVVILTPNETHFSLAKEALEAGKHVVVDKPFTVTTEQADQLIAVAERAGRLLTVFHNRRWDSDYLGVRRILERGVLGRLHRYECRWERFRPGPKGDWRENEGSGNGILYDLGSHMIDQVLCLFGRPESMLCKLRIQRAGTAAVDCFDWLCDYGLMQARLCSDCLTAVPTFHYQLIGDAGTFTKRGLDPQEEALKSGRSPGGPDWGVEAPELWGTLELAGAGGVVCERVPAPPGDYTRFYHNLAETLNGRAELNVTAGQARDVVRALELAVESDRKGGWVPWL